MASNFEPKDYWKVYLDKPTKERIREIQDHLEENYEGKTDFVQKALQNEKALSLEERIRRKEQEIEKEQQDLEQLRQMQREREQQDKLRDKRELLQEKQDKLRELADTDPISQEEAERQALQQLKQRSTFNGMSDAEISDTKSFEKKVDSLTADQDKNELVEDVQRLQKQVAELNGGPEDYFMKLEVDNQ